MFPEKKNEITVFSIARDLFNKNTGLFFKLLMYFSPAIFIVQFSGVLLNPHIENAESYARLGGRALLLCMSYMWLKALLENKNTISILHEINLKLVIYLLICLAFLFGPFWLIDLIEWALMQTPLPQRPALYLIGALQFGAIYFAIRFIFMLPGYIDGGKLSPLQSINMTKLAFLDVLWGFIFYAMPFAIFIFIYARGLHFALLKLDLLKSGMAEPISLYILFSPISLFIQPLLTIVGFTAVYVAYMQAKIIGEDEVASA